MSLPTLILASGSPRRAEILSSVGLIPEVRPSGTLEHRLTSDKSAKTWALRLAAEKAATATRFNRDAITIGADTMVVLDTEPLGKPDSAEEAVGTLRRLRNKTHCVVTAVALDGRFGKWSGWSSTEVKIRGLGDVEIDEYVRSGLPLDKAGSYGIQDKTFNPAEVIKGCYLNVVGLPLCLTGQLFEMAGVRLDVECADCNEPVNTVSVCS